MKKRRPKGGENFWGEKIPSIEKQKKNTGIHVKIDSKKPCYCWFFRVFELQNLAESAVLIRFFSIWLRWKADYQKIDDKTNPSKIYLFFVEPKGCSIQTVNFA